MNINISEEMKQRLIKLCCRKNGTINNKRDTKTFIKNNDAELYDYLCSVVDLTEYNDNIKEVILCILHDIEYRPICPVCGKHPRKFDFANYRYSLFCSVECEEKSKRDGTYFSFCDHTRPSKHKPKIQTYIWNGTIEGLKTFFKPNKVIRYSLFDYEKMKMYQPDMLQYFIDNYYIDENTPIEIINEVIYCFMNDINWNERPICPVCGERVPYIHEGSSGYPVFCSDKCRDSDEGKNIINNKRIETSLELFGVENPFQSEVCKQKIRKTTFEHFGVECSMQSEEVRNRAKNTTFERYGVEYSLQNKEVREKGKQTCLEKYGVEHPMQSEEIKQKMRETTFERFGVENASQSEEVKRKVRETTFEHFGVEWSLQSEEVRAKGRQTNLERYGVENASQSEEIKQKVRETTFERFGVEHAMQSEEIRAKGKQTSLEKYGVEHPMQSEEVKQHFIATINKKYGGLKEYGRYVHIKATNTLKRNHKYYGMTKIEQDVYKYLCSIFSIQNIQFNAIIDDRYPFYVDFYINSLDIFIEINAHYCHGKHPFGSDQNDQETLNKLIEKSKQDPKTQATNVILIWTKRDPLKIQTAKDNNLLYLPIWSNKIKVVIEEIEKFFKEHNLELPEPTYEYTEEELFPNLNKKEESK